MTETTTYSIHRDSSPLELKQRLLSFVREIGFDSCRRRRLQLSRRMQTSFGFGCMTKHMAK